MVDETSIRCNHLFYLFNKYCSNNGSPNLIKIGNMKTIFFTISYSSRTLSW